MFRKSPNNPQVDLLSSVEGHLDERRSRELGDPTKWHNTFYKQVFLQIDESVFKVLFDPLMGAPNSPLNQLVAMMILKEGMGLSDEQLFECCRYHLLFRQALGLVNLNDSIPTESTYYKFRQQIYGYDQRHGTDLLGEVFAGITEHQLLEFDLAGTHIRMDSALVGSNIAFYSRFELVHRTIMGFYESLSDSAKAEMPARLADELEAMSGEDAETEVYRSTRPQIQERLGQLGPLMGELVQSYTSAESDKYELLERVFHEQFATDSDAPEQIDPRAHGEIPADSVQSPHEAECSYRHKGDQSVKGYSINLTETIEEIEEEDDEEEGEGEEQSLNLVTDIQVAPANCSDSSFLGPAITASEERSGTPVEKCYADGAYNRSLEAEEQAGQQHVEMVLSGIQGSPSRFELNQTQQGLQVTDTKTGQVHKAQPVRRQKNSTEDRWKIDLGKQEGPRYFNRSAIRASARRQAMRERPKAEANKRNNVEASIGHLKHRLGNGKTKYRGLIKHKLWAWCRALWMNMRRIQRYMANLSDPAPQIA